MVPSKALCGVMSPRHVTRFEVSYVKAAQRTKALQLLEVFIVKKRHTTRPHP